MFDLKFSVVEAATTRIDFPLRLQDQGGQESQGEGQAARSCAAEEGGRGGTATGEGCVDVMYWSRGFRGVLS